MNSARRDLPEKMSNPVESGKDARFGGRLFLRIGPMTLNEQTTKDLKRQVADG
jgi:hypothetical protein